MVKMKWPLLLFVLLQACIGSQWFVSEERSSDMAIPTMIFAGLIIPALFALWFQLGCMIDSKMNPTFRIGIPVLLSLIGVLFHFLFWAFSCSYLANAPWNQYLQKPDTETLVLVLSEGLISVVLVLSLASGFWLFKKTKARAVQSS